MDGEDRATPGDGSDDALCLAVRRTAVEAEGDGRSSGGRYFRRGLVPSLADNATPGRVVSECGNDGSVGTVLCHVDFPSDSVLRHRVRRTARSLALPQPVRGCGLHR